MRKLVVVALLAMVGVVSACSAFGRGAFQEPVVTFKDVKVNGLGLTGGNLDVVLNVYNPNGYRLDATRLNYNLYVDSLLFGTGQLNDQFTVQKNDSTEVRLPLDFKWAGMNQAIRELINTGSVNYRVQGDMRVGSGAATYTIPFDRTGRFASLSGANR